MTPAPWPGAAAALDAVADLVLARVCAGCGEPGTRWCVTCASGLRPPAPLERVLTGGVVVRSAAGYDGAVREALNAWKDHGRADLTPVLAAALVPLLTQPASLLAPGTALVPVPSSAGSRRRRGREPVRELALGVRRRLRVLPVLPALRHVRTVDDQAGLPAAERARNISGAMQPAPGWVRRLPGRPVVVVDDVVTSGATILEAARALSAVGADVVGAVTVAATPRRTG